MSGRLSNIDYEIQKCMSELDTQSYMPGGDRKQCLRDAELRALEAEVFGDRKITTQLGVGFPNEQLGTKSYKLQNDRAVVNVSQYVSCQSGGMYDMKPKKSVNFVRSICDVQRSGTNYKLVVYRTNNKEEKLEACAIAVFEGARFVSYLFSTNDPLAFDNFNCFHGHTLDSKWKPPLNCVEQLVFCKDKVAINMRCLEKCGKSGLFSVAMTGGRIEHDTLVGILKMIQIDYQPVIDSIFARHSTVSDDFKAEALASVRTKIRELGEDKFFTAYVRYFENALDKRHDLIPNDEYKKIGRTLIAIPEYLDAFDSCGILCVVSARMRLLHQSPAERSLVASLVPRCVVECSKDDNLWAYMIVPTFNKDPAKSPVQQKLNWLLEPNGSGLYPGREARLFQIIEHATNFQDNYISALDRHIAAGNTDDTVAFLLNTCKSTFIDKFTTKPLDDDKAGKMDFSMHKLGLSERLLQALWTKQIVFPPEVIQKITEKLADYGVQYFHYVPNLVESGQNPLDIAMSIGVDHTAPAASVQKMED